MARLLTSGAGTGHPLADGFATAGGAWRATNDVVRSGAWSWKFTAGSAAAYMITYPQDTGVGDYFFTRQYLYVDSSSASAAGAADEILACDVGAGGYWQMRLGRGDLPSSGMCKILVDLPSAANVRQIDIPTGRWVRVETRTRAGDGFSWPDLLEIYIDGEMRYSVSDLFGWASISDYYFGKWSASTLGATYWLDDIAVNNSLGAAQNGLPGEGSVGLLLPISDASVAGGWQAPGKLTGLWSSIDNVPPIGVAHSTNVAFAENQVYNATAGTVGTMNYQLNLAPYNRLSGLLRAGDIRLMAYYMIVGASGTSPATTGRIEGISNMSGGASASETVINGVAGSYPAGWRRIQGAYLYAPAATVTSSPIIQISKQTASALAMLVAQAGAVVEYVPSTARPFAGMVI